MFHKACIDRWLSEKDTCPNCRHSQVPPAPTFVRDRPVSFVVSRRSYALVETRFLVNEREDVTSAIPQDMYCNVRTLARNLLPVPTLVPFSHFVNAAQHVAASRWSCRETEQTRKAFQDQYGRAPTAREEATWKMKYLFSADGIHLSVADRVLAFVGLQLHKIKDFGDVHAFMSVSPLLADDGFYLLLGEATSSGDTTPVGHSVVLHRREQLLFDPCHDSPMVYSEAHLRQSIAKDLHLYRVFLRDKDQ